MDYIVRNCPQCNKELPVPADLQECICMYCGEHFNIEEKLTSELGSVELQELKNAYQTALERIGELVDKYDKLLQGFTRERYSISFEEYVKISESILLPIDRYAKWSEEVLTNVATTISGKLMSVIKNNIEAKKGILHKNSQAMLIDQHRYFLAVYLVPMLGYLKLELSDMLAESIMEDWKRTYPKSEFKKATYEELAAGFLRKGFCFITSAVCDTLNKSEDCYELTRFREFRDHYLMNSGAGRRLVEEYYQTAPRIVAYINMQPGSEERYHELWDNYLQPCLLDIEHDRKRRCRNRYERMVRELIQQLPLAKNI